MGDENRDRGGSRDGGRGRDRGEGGNDRGEGGHQDERDDRGRESDRGDQDRELSTTEKVLTAISVAFTVLVFGFVAWQAVQPSTAGPPEATVVGVETGSNGSALVRVHITNPGNAGLLSATVEANCSQPPPEVTFENVPAGGRETGVLVCPAGTADPNVSVSSWIPV